MSSNGRGNTNARVRNWCFTINNPTITPIALGSKLTAHPHFRYVVFQSEAGANGTTHYQGYIEFSKPIRFNACKNIIGGNPHLEKRHGTRDQARDYCMKDATRLPNTSPHEYGTWATSPGARNDILQIADEFKAGKRIREIANEYPAVYVRYHKGLEKLYSMMQTKRTEVPLVTLLYGKTGVGKTRAVMGMPDVFKKDGTDQWFDGYAGEDILLIDDFAGKKSRITLSFMLNLLDRYEVRLPIKGSFVDLSAKSIFVTTNIHPRLWYDYSDREEHYNALKRRFSHVIYYPRAGPHEMEVTPKSFWDDWSQFCDEDQVFIEVEESTVEETQPTQQMSQHYCFECGFIEDLCKCNDDSK